MASVRYLTEMLERIKEGEACSGRDWDNKIVPKSVKKILKKYELAGTYNPEIPVNQDLELADRFFEAGLELAETIGVQCTDTETVVKFSRQELLDALKQAPEELILGTGPDQVTLKARTPEDKTKPLFCTSLSIQIDEDIYAELVSELIRYKNIDILQGPSIDTVYGIPAFSGTPFETAAGIREAQLREEAIWRAGRPGIPQMGLSSSVTEFGFMAGYAANEKPGRVQMGIGLQPSEIKTNYCNFNKMMTAAAFADFRGRRCCYDPSGIWCADLLRLGRPDDPAGRAYRKGICTSEYAAERF